jgi:hypothetical protein
VTDLTDTPGQRRTDRSGDGRRDRDPGRRGLQRTPLQLLIVAGLIGALIGWTIAAVSGRDGVPARVAWSGPVTLLAAAAVVVCIAVLLHQRLQVHRRRIDPRQAVAWLALGKAAALVGALMAGGYAGFAVRFLTELDTEASRERVIRSGVAVLGGLVLTIAALRIERACEVPGGDDDGDDDEDDQSAGS